MGQLFLNIQEQRKEQSSIWLLIYTIKFFDFRGNYKTLKHKKNTRLYYARIIERNKALGVYYL